jgi:plastocyanin
MIGKFRGLVLFGLVLSGLPTAVDRAIAQSGWGNIKGRIVWEGQLPQVRVLDVNKDQEWCIDKRPGGAPPDEVLVVNPKTKAVKNVICHVKAVKAIHPDYPQDAAAVKAADEKTFEQLNKIRPAELPDAIAAKKVEVKDLKARAMINQVHCQYVPHAIAVREGERVLVLNPEPITHNVKVSSLSGKNDANPNLPSNTATIFEWKAEPFPMSVECSIHGWMKMVAMVFNHPYFAVTDDDGSFEIKNVPAGPIELVLRNPKYIERGLKITVQAGQTVQVEVKYDGTKAQTQVK